MRLDLARRWQRLNCWQQLAAGAWAIVLVVVCAHALLRPHARNLFALYAAAAHDWCSGISPYRNQTEAYRYSPCATAMLVPCAALGRRCGGTAWRLANAGVFLGALAWWGQVLLPYPANATRRALLFLLVAPLSVGNLYNGQCNPLIAGVLVAAMAAAAGGRWNLAAACIAFAFAFKVYPLAVGLLLVVVYPRRLGLRVLVALVLVMGAPFLCQRPTYVARQYADWFGALGHNDRSGWPLTLCYRDLWMLFRVWHVPVWRGAYVALQLLAAGGAAALCHAGRKKGWPARKLLTDLLALGVCWMLLFGPATESTTYILAAPVLAWAIVDACTRPGAVGVRVALLGSLTLLLVPAVAAWFPGVARIHALGLQPLGVLLLLVSVVVPAVRTLAGLEPVEAKTVFRPYAQAV